MYKEIMQSEEGNKISSIKLVDLTPREAQKAAKPMDLPGGRVCLNLKPTKKLMIEVDINSPYGSSTWTSENFIAKKDGKFVIPVPGPCK